MTLPSSFGNLPLTLSGVTAPTSGDGTAGTVLLYVDSTSHQLNAWVGAATSASTIAYTSDLPSSPTTNTVQLTAGALTISDSRAAGVLPSTVIMVIYNTGADGGVLSDPGILSVNPGTNTFTINSSHGDDASWVSYSFTL